METLLKMQQASYALAAQDQLQQWLLRGHQKKNTAVKYRLC